MFIFFKSMVAILLFLAVNLGGCRVPSGNLQDEDTGSTDTGDTSSDLEVPSGGGCPDDSWDQFDNEMSPYLGGEQEVLVEVSIATDFHCPYCKDFAMLLMDLYSQPEYQKFVRLYYHHHPLYMHPDVWEIHYAAEAVARQSFEKFWVLHDKVYERENDGNRMTIEEVVQFVDDNLELDMDQFNEDRASEEIADFIVAEKYQAVNQGLNGTPSTWVCGNKIYWVDMPGVIENYLAEGGYDAGVPDTEDTDTGTGTDTSDGGTN